MLGIPGAAGSWADHERRLTSSMDVRFVNTTIGQGAVAVAPRPRTGSASAAGWSEAVCAGWLADTATKTHIQATRMFDVPNHLTRRLWERSP